MFSAGDDAARQRYAVLGSAVPEMFGGNPAAMIHQTILIRGIPFEIIGVLSEKGAAGGFGNPDEQILIPLQRLVVVGAEDSAVGDHDRAAPPLARKHGEDVRAQRRDPLLHRLLRPRAQRHHGDHSAHADDDTQHRENRP